LLSPGTIVSGYRVDGVLGEGGMGVVYRATQLSLNRTVALKILAVELSQDGAFRERFRREGLLQAAIDHQHIVTVYDTGDTEHGLFLAMRLIRGPTLKDMIHSGELDPGRTLRILTQVAGALDTAHDVGLTHRDIKPQNILIGAEDHAYLADFGLTQASDEVSLTETGQFIGTIDYVAPEQVQGLGASARSDVYSLTAVLYEALTGVVPFLRMNEAAVLFAHISETPPPVTERRADLPTEIDAVIERGMAKAPEDRYASAGELIAAARAAFGDETAIAAAPPPPAPLPTERAADTIRAGEQTRARRTQPTPGVAPAAAITPPGGTPIAAPSTIPSAPTGQAESPAAPPPAAAPARRGLTGGAIALLAGLGVAAAIGGFLIGNGGSSGAGETAMELGNSASAGTVEVSFPDGWQRVSEQPEVPGVRFRDPIVLAAGAPSGARIVAGQVRASGPALLSAGLMRRLPDPVPEGEPVRLGDFEALRYPRLQPLGFDGDLRLYAVATTDGVATIACTGPGGTAGETVRRDCESIATTLELPGTKAYTLGPQEDYARRLGGILNRLNQNATSGTDELRQADSQEAQADAAAGLAGAYRRASESVLALEVSPRDAAANRSLGGALERTGSAYAAAAAAARSNNSAGYSAAQGRVRRSLRAVQAAMRDFTELGYTLS
jgi:predicted Ser/Thr protein kinase